jgi:lipopolysaccharide/colanic/teichoic acid biosynthesis glycosyltransferase
MADMKRLLDIFLSAAGLILLAPFLPVVALLIKLDSDGPVFFLQERIGRSFKPFVIYKFRTMRPDEDTKGALITSGDDSRVTRIGRILRRYKIDELPQLLNVLKGEMSFVGPRPEVKKYVQRYERQYRKLLTVRPGITDPASLKFSNEEALIGKSSGSEEVYTKKILPEKIRLSAKYVDERTLLTDLELIVKTILKTSHAKEDRGTR